MKSISYDIDPGGDIELILKKPNKQNIVPKIRPWKDFKNSKTLNSPCLGRYEVFSELYPGEDDQNKTAEEVEVHMRVSSHHLQFASLTFRAMLQGPWIEAAPSSQSIRPISTEGWDAFALAIVLDCIHGRHFEIPTEITPGLLTRISTIVDYYQCREAVQVHYRTWADDIVCGLADLESLEDQMIIMWLFVSWVFHDEIRFGKMAGIFLHSSSGISQFATHDLPVSGILGKLDGMRQPLLKKVSEALADLQRELTDEEGCEEHGDSSCSVILLGILMRVRRRTTDLVAPFEGCNLDEILGDIKYMDDLVSQHHQPNKYKRKLPQCTIQGRLGPVLEEIEEVIKGVRLADFKS
ncbi:hypothetical protein FNYG_06690 [Fusarium nygamai]|uniref:BTB domain-containing protein n=1 Tax=Gibberella nygamai TaxID=42673 RepID=A0A2K0WCI1_GIBNY|nr:hypothetical protein FNYG_06690 [Fusarium nygamai]